MRAHTWAPMTREAPSDRPGSTHRSSCQRLPYPRYLGLRRVGTAWGGAPQRRRRGGLLVVSLIFCFGVGWSRCRCVRRGAVVVSLCVSAADVCRV